MTLVIIHLATIQEASIPAMIPQAVIQAVILPATIQEAASTVEEDLLINYLL